MYRNVLRITLPKQICPRFRRLIFTDEYLNLDKFKEGKDRAREELTTARLQYKPSALKSRIQASADRGLLLSEDLASISCMVSNQKDLEDFKKLLERYVELNKNNAIVLTNAGRITITYFKLCHILRLPELALDMFHNPVVESRFVHGTGLYVDLLDLLFKEGKYTEALEVFNKLMIDLDDQANFKFDLLTLTLLSIYKSGGEDAFAKATTALNTFYSRSEADFKDAWGRGTYVYALMASKAGEYTLAYEAIQKNNFNSVLKYNIELDTLAKMGRPLEAASLLDKLTVDLDVPTRMTYRKPIVLSSVVDSIVKAVREEDDPEVTEKVRSTFARLDNSADIIDEDIEKFLLAPIKGKPKDEREKENGSRVKRRQEEGGSERNKDYDRTRSPRNKKLDRLA